MCSARSMYGKALFEAGADVVIIADPTASCDLIRPKTFKELVRLAIAKVVKAIGGVTFLHICSNITSILTEMVDTGVNSISIDEKVNFTQAKVLLVGRVKVAGNISTRSALFLKKSENIKEACRKVLEAGVDILNSGYGIAPGTPMLT